MRAEHVAAHVRDELHDALGQLVGGSAQRPEELMQDEAHVGARAEPFKMDEAEYHQRHQRQQRRVREAHRPHVDFAREPVADDGGGVAQQPQHRPPGAAHVRGIFGTIRPRDVPAAVHGTGCGAQPVSNLSASR